MLLGGDAGHGLEPVGEMGGALFDGPVLHGVGHNRCRRAVKPLAFIYGTLDLLEHVLGQTRPHYRIIENH